MPFEDSANFIKLIKEKPNDRMSFKSVTWFLSFTYQGFKGTLVYPYRKQSSFAELRESTTKKTITSSSAPGWVLTFSTL